MKTLTTDTTHTVFQLIFFPLLLLFLTFTCSATPSAIAASDMDTVAKQADKQIRDAERMMYSGKSEEALALLGNAETAMEQIKATEPANSRLKSLESKYIRIKKALDRKLSQSSQAVAESPTPPPAQATTDSQSDKLPAGVSKRLRDISRELDDSERALAKQKIKNANYKLSGAKDLFAEIDQKFSGQFSSTNPEYKAVADRFAALETSIVQGAGAKAEAEANATQVQAEANAKADEWIEKFSPYITGSYFPSGHTPSKQLLFPGTSQPEKFVAMNVIHQELKTLYNEFLQSGVPQESSWQLNTAANDVKRALENYESSMQSGQQGIMQNAASNIEQALNQLNRDPKWKDDPKILPSLIDKDWMSRIDEMVSQTEQAFQSGDPNLVALQGYYKQLVAQDQEHRKMRTDRRRMEPEAYKGKDVKDIRKQAEKVVSKEKSGSKILGVSVYGENWKEERVLEHTDTTQTAIRYRVTQMINVQVAASQDGKVELHTIHIGKDQQSSDWGPLYGHIMYSEPMLKKNVKK